MQMHFGRSLASMPNPFFGARGRSALFINGASVTNCGVNCGNALQVLGKRMIIYINS